MIDYISWGWSKIGSLPTWIIVVVGCVIFLPLLPMPREQYIRGSRIVSGFRLRVRLSLKRMRDYVYERAPTKTPIMIGKIPVPHNVEPLHFFVAGSTGVGKTQLIHSFLRVIRTRGERAIIADIGGDLMASHAFRGDVILNPLDSRSRVWSPFSEMRSITDADRIAASMIPAGEGESGEWHRYSQSLIAAVLQRLFERGEATNERLFYYLTVAKTEEIEPLIAGLPAQTLFDTGAAKMLSSLRGIIGSYLPAYRFLPANAGRDDFSISEWIAEASSGWLWLPYQDRDAASLRPLLAAWVGEAVSSILSLSPDPARRIWLVLDELASLGLVGSLTDALTKGRKYGLVAVLGLQSVSQLRSVYGREGAATLLSCLRNSVVYAVDDPDTADYMSRRLGEVEHERWDETVSDGKKTETSRRTISRAVLPSQIMNLPNLAAYLSLAGDYPVVRVSIPVVPSQQYVAPFVPTTNRR